MLGFCDMEWQPIETAPKNGTLFDAWLGDTGDAVTTADEDDIDFYCTHGTLRSPGWHWLNGKFRPYLNGLATTTFVQPSHWMPLPEPPNAPQ